jgi:lipopolysaccharide/colanic/teichoic acid biosynthesis glycosyltransferase
MRAVAGAADVDRDPQRGSPQPAGSVAPGCLSSALRPRTPPAGDPRRGAIALLAKHAFDRVAAVVGLVALGPLLVALVVALRLTGRGRAIVGVTHWSPDGRSFQRLGLRASGRGWLDARIARSGLRHLPELINVARGEMSLVGPRPRRIDVAHAPGLPETRLRSGLTGWAQIHRPADPATERLLDAVYVRDWSLCLDARILWRTIMRS